MFTISCEGDQTLRQHVESIICQAPNLADWEFYSSRQARRLQAEVELLSDGIRLSTARWRFSPSESLDKKKLDLIIVAEEFANLGQELALKAVFLFLDSALGEDNVEAWIGKIHVQGNTRDLHPVYEIQEIQEYVEDFVKKSRKSLPNN